jgi:short-subunit dehydrogenase
MSVTLITGASSGIGRSLALSLAARGEAIAAVARRRELLDTLVREITAKGGRAIALPCDVTDRSQVLQAVATASEALGPIDRLIANAGGGERTSVDDFRAEQIAAMLALNVVGTANCIEAVLPAMLARGRGHIVVMSSIAGFRGLPGAAGYSAAKAALTTLAEALRADLRPRGIDVTVLTPGFIHTKPGKKRRPFELSLEVATGRMVTAILARRRAYAFPWTLVLIARGARLLPAVLYDAVAAGLRRGKS